MAMTTCPNCGEQISDKAKKCVHCGAVLVPEEKKYCPDCGAELEEGMDTCPKCGCPIENIIETENSTAGRSHRCEDNKKIKENNCDCNDSSFSSQIADINDNKDTVNSLMKKLKNPPEEYKDAYESLSKLYDAYISLTNLVTDPTGSLQTYSQNFNDADNETLNCYNALKMYLEE